MKRRDFLKATAGLGAAYLTKGAVGEVLGELSTTGNKRYNAHDTVVLGKTGIKTSLLAMGTGTHGSGGHSNQTRLSDDGGLPRLLLDGYEQGLNFFDSADQYGSHPYVGKALGDVTRDKVVVMTKTNSRDPQAVRADLDRFRRELKTDYIDIVLLHCVVEDDWTTRFQGAMEVLSEAKEKGMIRAHGCSCHSIGALRAAAASPWVEIDLARLNPIGAHMDADPETVIGVLRQMKAQGKGVVGMKILGQGAMRNRQDEALKFALNSGVLDAITIGAENKVEQKDLIRRISAVA